MEPDNNGYQQIIEECAQENVSTDHIVIKKPLAKWLLA